jgi:diacylglycerol kinase family enzyme
VLTERANHARDLLQSLPLFNSHFPFQIVLTERANHARDLLQSLPLAHLDGVISVGGDGMFAEVKNCPLPPRFSQKDDCFPSLNF